MLLLSGFVGGLKAFTVVFLLGVIIIYFRTHSVVRALFPLLVFSLQFIGPNKFYFVEAVPQRDIVNLTFSDGYFIGYGVNVSSVLMTLGLLLLLREVYLKKNGTTFFKQLSWYLVVCCVGFVSVALIAALYYSPFFSLSLVWTLQYAAVFSMALLCVYLYTVYRQLFLVLFSTTIAWTSIFQSGVVILQFIKQEYTSFGFELASGSSFYTGLDENNALFRPAGSFINHNQAAFILSLFLSILLPQALLTKKNIYTVASFFLLIAIILIQSRSIWIATTVTVVMTLRLFRTEVSHLIAKAGKTRLQLYLVGMVLVLSPIVVPRVLLSANFFYKGAGLPFRVDMIKEAVQVISSSSVIGYGPGTPEYITHQFFPDGVTSYTPAPVHNGFLQLIEEVGVVGVSFFLFPFYYLLRKIEYSSVFTKHAASSVRQFSFLLCCFTCLIYYSFLPHSGIVEFAYLGIILSLGYSIPTKIEHAKKV